MVHQTIRTSTIIAPNASRKSGHMLNVLWRPRTARPVAILGALGTALLTLLAACASTPLEPPIENTPPTPAPVGAAEPLPGPNGSLVRGRARWVPVRFADLPGWDADRVTELWPALLRGCDKPAPGWAAVCTQARSATLPAFSDDAARVWLQQHLQAYRVESTDGLADGLMTGYFEPLVEASRLPRADMRVPLFAPPPELSTRKPYLTRQQLDLLPPAQAALRGRPIAYVADPLDQLILQIQGSGRLNLAEPDGSRKWVRLAFAANNEQPYKSVGRWLIDQGELTPAQASWPGIKAWARAHPQRLNEMLWANPRVVFFREEALPDPQIGPKGAQGVALTPGRSIAVDPTSIPYGTPVWLDTTEPLSITPLRRLVMAQDTGTAITGAVRADYFWGWGADAEAQAGRMKQPLRLWVLRPRS
jgi:membrane-bound lytic murein transglycosylase A